MIFGTRTFTVLPRRPGHGEILRRWQEENGNQFIEQTGYGGNTKPDVKLARRLKELERKLLRKSTTIRV